MLILETETDDSGFSANWKHALDAVCPEAKPGQKVPTQILIAQAINATALIGDSTAPCVKIINEVINAKIIGVSINAWLINVKVKIRWYAFLLKPTDLHAAFENIAKPIAGPMPPSAIHNPLDNNLIAPTIEFTELDWNQINRAIINPKIIGVWINDKLNIRRLEILFAKKGCLAIAKQACLAGYDDAIPTTIPDIEIASAIPKVDNP